MQRFFLKIYQYIKGYRLQCSSTTFCLLYTFFTFCLYNDVYIRRISAHLDVNNIADAIFVLAYSSVLFAILFSCFLIVFNRVTLKFLSILFALINATAAYFIREYNVPIEEGMITNIFSTDTKEVLDLLSINLFVQIVVFGILPGLVILKTNIIYKNFIKEFLHKLFISLCMVIFIVGVLFIQYKEFSIFVRGTKGNFDYLLPVNYVRSSFKILYLLSNQSHEFTEIAQDAKMHEGDKKMRVIFVVGEAARKHNFSLYGYERKTNPYLEKDDVVVIENTTSCGTATAISLPCMFSHLSRNEFVKNKKNYEFLPSFLNRLGIDILWKDNNFGGCKGVCDNVKSIMTQQIKSSKFCSSGECLDEILLEDLDKYIASDKANKSMIILHQNGSHGPRYDKRYPMRDEIFSPVCKKNELIKCSQEELINGYDNTILYTDEIIHKMISIVKHSKAPTVVIYASDHGESLGENNIYLHGFPYFFAPKEQKEIPFIIWMSDSFKKQKNMTASNQCFNKKKEYSHDNIFHSILGLFDITTELYQKELDIFAECK